MQRRGDQGRIAGDEVVAGVDSEVDAGADSGVTAGVGVEVVILIEW